MAVSFNWQKEKDKFYSMALKEKRKLYLSEFEQLDKVETWATHLASRHTPRVAPEYVVNPLFNEKVSIWVGNITELEVDAIVSVGADSLIKGRKVWAAIRKAAGDYLRQECISLGNCDEGKAVITGGYLLPARNVIHTVGPHASNEQVLKSCYSHCLKCAVHHGLESIAFPCIAAGDDKLFAFDKAVEIAVSTVRQWLEQYEIMYTVERIILCIYDAADLDVYIEHMCRYFPGSDRLSQSAAAGGAAWLSNDNQHVVTPKSSGHHQPVTHKRDRSLAAGSTVKVKDIPDGFVYCPVVLNVDATDAGTGRLDVKINGPNNTKPRPVVRCTSINYFEVSFIPQAASDHNIYIRYNDDIVPGSPFTCKVEEVDNNAIKAAWNTPRVLQVGRSTIFTVKTKSFGPAPVPNITVTDNRGKEVESFKLKSFGGQVDITPTQEGNYWIYATVGTKPVHGSPFECQVLDPSRPTAAKQQNGQTAGPAGAKSIKYTTPINWKKGKRLGVGGFGEVFLCYDEDTGRELAVKQIPLDQKNTKFRQELQAVLAEVKLLSNLKHDRIVQYVGYNEDSINSVFSIFMEYMPGGSVMDQIKTYGTLTEKVAGNYTRQVLEGLDYLHQLKIIHRDIKSGNILRDTWANVKLADFGCSKEFQRGQMHTVGVGTFNWMSPEILSGNYDSKTDIWSLGCTVVEMMTGKPPWSDTTAVGILVNKITKSDIVEYKLKQNASSTLKYFLNQCFKRKPFERPAAHALQSYDFCKQHSGDRAHGTPV